MVFHCIYILYRIMTWALFNRLKTAGVLKLGNLRLFSIRDWYYFINRISELLAVYFYSLLTCGQSVSIIKNKNR